MILLELFHGTIPCYVRQGEAVRTSVNVFPFTSQKIRKKSDVISVERRTQRRVGFCYTPSTILGGRHNVRGMGVTKRGVSLISLFAVMMLVIASCGGSDGADPTATVEQAAVATATVETAAEPTATDEPEPTATATEEPEPTATATPEPAGQVTVDALWFSQDATNVYGGTSTVRVTVKPNDSGELRVGFFESEVGGSGPQWRAAGWMAVITASLLLGEDPSKYEFSFDVTGRIDGPSAGALMTAAVLAGFLGHEIDPSITMTGTINPDGTVGPVGGIPHKIAGAAEAGKTVVLVPGGQRFDYDYALAQSVDLVQVGTQNGVEVRLVPDIYSVYTALTGETLPTIESSGQASMPPAAFDKLRASATGWYARYQSERSNFQALPATVQEYRVDLIDLADYYAAEADRLLAEGQVSNAFRSAWTAAGIARVATQAAELDNLYETVGIDPMIARLESTQAAEKRLNAVTQKIDAERPRTATDSVAIMDAASNLSVAQGLIFEAQTAIADLQYTEYTEDDILAAIYAAAFNYALADIYLDLAEDTMSIGLGFGSSPAPSQAVLDAISSTLRRGAEANITYFETLIVEPWAQTNGVSADVAKYYFQQADTDYLTAVSAITGAELLTSSMMRPEAQATMWLGASMTAYSNSAAVIAKYYSLGAQVDEFGSVTGYDRSTALADMLDLADDRAKQWLNGVAGEEPVPSLYYYENARILRQGTPEDQLEALRDFWQSTVLSEVLAIFASSE